MRYLLKASAIVAAISLQAIAPAPSAQENTFTLTCQNVGSSPPPSRSEIARAIQDLGFAV